MIRTSGWQRKPRKYKIGLIYATQEVTSVDEMILANTSNWVVTHLNNHVEVKELSKYYDFEDFAELTLKAEDVGFVGPRRAVAGTSSRRRLICLALTGFVLQEKPLHKRQPQEYRNAVQHRARRLRAASKLGHVPLAESEFVKAKLQSYRVFGHQTAEDVTSDLRRRRITWHRQGYP